MDFFKFNSRKIIFFFLFLLSVVSFTFFSAEEVSACFCDDLCVQFGDCCDEACGPGYYCDAGVCRSSCTPSTCSSLGYDCGWQDDGCGGSIYCGSCSGTCDGGTCCQHWHSQECDGGTVVFYDSCGNQHSSHTCSSGVCYDGMCCTPNTCPPNECTVIDAGCGLGYDVCYGPCDYGDCFFGACPDCQPGTCSSLGYDCGWQDDGCGGSIYCGSCSSGYYCDGGECVQECVPNCQWESECDEYAPDGCGGFCSRDTEGNNCGASQCNSCSDGVCRWCPDTPNPGCCDVPGGQQCVDMRSDEHCGSCGNSCGPEETCCIPNSDGIGCANLNEEDGTYCGSCGNKCPSGHICSNGSCIEECSTQSYKACFGGDVYWYDSCGNREGLAESCSGCLSCSGGACYQNDSNCLQGSWNCSATSECQEFRMRYICNASGSCSYDSSEYRTNTSCTSLCPSSDWYDTGSTRWVHDSGCREKQQKEQEFRLYVCDTFSGCVYHPQDDRWVDTGNTRDNQDLCPAGQNCQNGVCGCVSEYSRDCYNGDAYWYDSCGNRGDLIKSCIGCRECSNGYCYSYLGDDNCAPNCGWCNSDGSCSYIDDFCSSGVCKPGDGCVECLTAGDCDDTLADQNCQFAGYDGAPCSICSSKEICQGTNAWNTCINNQCGFDFEHFFDSSCEGAQSVHGWHYPSCPGCQSCTGIDQCAPDDSNCGPNQYCEGTVCMDECEDYSYKDCYLGDSWWYDSCGNRQTLADNCPKECDWGMCVDCVYSYHCPTDEYCWGYECVDCLNDSHCSHGSWTCSSLHTCQSYRQLRKCGASNTCISDGLEYRIDTSCTNRCSSDGWYDTGSTRWVHDSGCREKEQKEQNYRSHYCSFSGLCLYTVTDNRWVDTGNTREDIDLCFEGSWNCSGVRPCQEAKITPSSCDNGVCQFEYLYREADHCQDVNARCDEGYHCEGGECVETCRSQEYKSCYMGDVWWYDSCDIRESLAQSCSYNEFCQDGECLVSTLAPPDGFYFSSPFPLSGGVIGYARFYWSPDDIRAGGVADGVSYTSQIRYLDSNQNPITLWGSATTSLTQYLSYYRVGFSISSNVDHAYAQFRSRGAHPSFHNSDWVYSGFFEIDHVKPPSVTTLSQINVSSSGATIRGNLTDMGNDSQVGVYFEWGPNISFGETTPTIQRSTIGTFSRNITDLDYNTTYYYRAVGLNSAGFSNGSTLSFTTDKINLNPPEYWNSTNLQGGVTGYTRFYYSPDDGRIGGKAEETGYTTEIRYYDQFGNPLTGWGSPTSSFAGFFNYYRASFPISSNTDYYQAAFRSKATNPDYYDSQWVESGTQTIHHAPSQPGEFTNPTFEGQLNGGEVNNINWGSVSYWGNPQTNRNYRLEVSYNGGSWEYLADTGISSHYSHLIDPDLSLETITYRVVAESTGGSSSYRYSSTVSVYHSIPEVPIGSLYWNEDYHDYNLHLMSYPETNYRYCNSNSVPLVDLGWDYFSGAGHEYESADIQISRVVGNFDQSYLVVDVEGVESDSMNYSIGIELDFDKTYHWRVRVRSENGYTSGWAYDTFETDKKRAAVSFAWTPRRPYIEEKVNFINRTVEGEDALIINWYWEFQGADRSNSIEENPEIEFISEVGPRVVELRATDEDDVCCYIQRIINTRAEVPEWEEVDPFN